MDLLLHNKDGRVGEPAGAASIPAREFVDLAWPVQPGDYAVRNPRSAIALLLVGETLAMDDSFFSAFASIAITGTLTTENIGVEYVVKNLISNPFIRHLAILGKEIAGHRPADAIFKLAANGIDANQRIIEARGARPVLRNLPAAAVEHFRAQITVHNLLDCADPNLLAQKVHSLGLLPHEPCSAALHVSLIDPIEARPARHLQLDPEGYFIILTNSGRKNPLRVEHYKNSGALAHIIEGKDSATLCADLIEKKLVSRLDHAAYLGRELVRAENALRQGTRYIQDRAQGEINRR